MPIYAYKCSACGHAKDVLQKISDAPLTACPSCGAQAFSKQVTAAGFQLKGSGWYVTDFRNNNSGAAPAKKEGADAPADGAKGSDAAKTDAPAPAPAPAPAAAPAAAPAGSPAPSSSSSSGST